MNKSVASILSWIFQPLLMATYLLAILLWMAPASIGSFFNDMIKLWLFLVIFLTTCVIPLIGLVIMRLTSSIKSFHLSEREERIVPFFFIAIFYIVASYLIVSRLNISNTVNIIFFTTSGLVLTAAFVTIYWKVSIHSIGMSGVLGFLIALNALVPDSISVWLIILWVLFTGLTMTARLYLNEHRPAEVYGGAILGFTIPYFAIIIFA